MTKTKTTTHKAEAKEAQRTRGIREVLEELKGHALKMESSSSNGDVREACRNFATLIDSYLA